MDIQMKSFKIEYCLNKLPPNFRICYQFGIFKPVLGKLDGYILRGSFYVSFGYSYAAILSSTCTFFHFMSLLYKPLSTFATE